MMDTPSITLDSTHLIPSAWRQNVPATAFRIYNPAIVRFRNRLLMSYRVDSSWRGDVRRRIGICQLSDDLAVIPGSVLPLSDRIVGGDPRQYDPRFLVYGDRLLIHYNNNFNTRPNQIWMVELDADTLEAKFPARLLHLVGPRQEIEKNWMFFEYDGTLFAVYQIAPHTILRVNLDGEGAVECKPLYTTTWPTSAYADTYGLPRGGTPPVRQGNLYTAFYHSWRAMSPWRWVLRFWPVSPNIVRSRFRAALDRRLRPFFGQIRCAAGAYTFEAAPPFRPLWITPKPIIRPEDEPRRQHRIRTNPYADGVVYPGGALPWRTGQWLVSYGVHDERCCLRLVTL